MDHKNTNKAVMTFIILSVIVHGIIAYVIVKTNNNEQNSEPIEIVNQDELNQKPEYKEPPVRKKRIARKKPRVKKPLVKEPRAETSSTETPSAEKETDQGAGAEVLSALPEALPSGSESSDKKSLEKELESVTVSDEKSDITVNAGDQSDASKANISGEVGVEEGNVTENEIGTGIGTGTKTGTGTGTKTGASSDGSDSVAIQELKKVTDIAEKSTNGTQTSGTSEASEGALSSSENSELSGQVSSRGKSVQVPQALKSSPGLKKKHGPTYRVDQVSVIRPTNFKYPQASRRLKEEGTAILRVFFDKGGQPQKVKVIKSTGSSRLDGAARQGVRTLRLKPLGYAFIYELPVRFQLDFTDQQLNQSFDFLAPGDDGLGKFKTKAQNDL